MTMKKICLFLMITVILVSSFIIATSAAGVTIEITAQPQSYGAPENSVVSYKVQAEGYNLKYRWYFMAPGDIRLDPLNTTDAASIPVSGSITGVNSDTIFISGVTPELDGFSLYCVISDGYGEKIESARAYINVSEEGAPLPVEMHVVPSVMIPCNKVLKLACNIYDYPDDVNITYQWYETSTGKLQDIIAIIDAEDPVLVDDTDKPHTSYYVCMVTLEKNGKETRSYTHVIPVTVYEPIPEVNYNFNATEIDKGMKTKIEADVYIRENGIGEVKYQWYHSSSNYIGTGEPIKGATGTTLDINGSDYTGTHMFYLIVTNDFGGVEYSNMSSEMPVVFVTYTGNNHKHVPSSGWKHDEESHWKECVFCGDKSDSADHTFVQQIQKEATSTTDGSYYDVCSVCGFKMGPFVIKATGTEPEPATEVLTEKVTEAPTEAKTELPSESGSEKPTEGQTEAPTTLPTEKPTENPTEGSTERPTEAPQQPKDNNQPDLTTLMIVLIACMVLVIIALVIVIILLTRKKNQIKQ